MAGAGFAYHSIGRASLAPAGAEGRAVTKAHRFNPTVLREYDIRGTVGKTIGRDDAYAVGRGFGSFVARRRQAGLRRL